MNPLPMIVGFMAASVFTIGLGVYFVKRGLKGIREKEFPLSDTKNVNGVIAQVAGATMVVFGALAVISGVAIIAFGFWRIPQLSGPSR